LDFLLFVGECEVDIWAEWCFWFAIIQIIVIVIH